jgi:hypothetical protein
MKATTPPHTTPKNSRNVVALPFFRPHLTEGRAARSDHSAVRLNRPVDRYGLFFPQNRYQHSGSANSGADGRVRHRDSQLMKKS